MKWGSLFRPQYIYIILGIVMAAGAVWYFFFRQSGPLPQLLVVHPVNFAQQISISGTVQAAEDVDLGFAQSGRVSGVYAKVGNTIRHGALLAQIDNGDVRANLAQKQAALQTAQADFASLLAGTRPEEIAVAQAQVDSDTSALAQTNAAIIDAIQTSYTQSDDAVRNKVDQMFNNARTSAPSLAFTTSNSQLESFIKTERVAMENTLASWQADVTGLSGDADLVAAAQAAQTNSATVTSFLSDANTILTIAMSNSTITQATINTYITSVATGRSNVNTAATALTSAVSAQKAAAAKLATDQKTLALKKAGSTQEDISAQEARVASARADVQNAQAQLGKTLVVAPFDGIITRMDAKVGEIISPTTPQISMISNGLFEIETFIPEVEIIGLAVGNLATTTLDAYGPDVQFAAHVIAIDPAETTVNGVSTYKTTLQFSQPDVRIKPGMTAAVAITTAVSPNALVVPQGAVFFKNGQQVVQVMRGNTRVDVPVQTGSTATLGSVQVVSGLSDGDSVVLNPDTSR